MTSTTQDDPELAAMAQVLKILEPLEAPGAQQRVLDWVRVRLGLSASPQDSAPPPTRGSDGAAATGETPTGREGTVNTVSMKLGADSCRTLLVAAAAYLTLFKGNEKFSREQLVATAKEARAWRGNYGVQTSININRMLESGELIEKSKNVYDLSRKKIADLEQKLRDQ